MCVISVFWTPPLSLISVAWTPPVYHFCSLNPPPPIWPKCTNFRLKGVYTEAPWETHELEKGRALGG